MRDREEENSEIYALKEEIELCHRKLEGLDEIVDALKAENELLRKVIEETAPLIENSFLAVKLGKALQEAK